MYHFFSQLLDLAFICTQLSVKKNKKDINIKNIVLGVGSLLNITNFVNVNNIYTFKFHISIKNGIPINIEKNQNSITESYDVNGIDIDNNYLLVFSSAMVDVLDNSISISNFNELSNSLNEQYRHHKFFIFFIKFGLCFLLGSLVINFIFFNHYFNKVNELRLSTESTLLNSNKIQFHQALKNGHITRHKVVVNFKNYLS